MSDQVLSPASEDTPLKGVMFLVGGITIFTLQDVIIRTLSADYPAHEIVFVRGLVALLPLAFFVHLAGGARALKTRRPVLVALRGFAGFVSYTTYYLAIAAMPLAKVVTLFYTSPFFVTALAVPLLGEVVGRRRWMAVGAGFVGVVAVMRPVAGTIEAAEILAVLAAVSYAAMALITRYIGRSESSASMSFHAMVVFIVTSGLIGLAIGDGGLDRPGHASAHFLLRAWVVPGPRDLALMALCGLIAGVGFYCLSQAYRVAPPSLVAPFEYTALPWAVLWGYLFWRELPAGPTLVGIVLIVGSGLYILHRENVRGRRMVTGRPLRPRV